MNWNCQVPVRQELSAVNALLYYVTTPLYPKTTSQPSLWITAKVSTSAWAELVSACKGNENNRKVVSFPIIFFARYNKYLEITHIRNFYPQNTSYYQQIHYLCCIIHQYRQHEKRNIHKRLVRTASLQNGRCSWPILRKLSQRYIFSVERIRIRRALWQKARCQAPCPLSRCVLRGCHHRLGNLESVHHRMPEEIWSVCSFLHKAFQGRRIFWRNFCLRIRRRLLIWCFSSMTLRRKRESFIRMA